MSLVAAWRSMIESWQRSLLSALGVMVATIAILLLISIGIGVRADFTEQVEDLGVNVLVAVPGRVNLQMGFNPNLAGMSWFEEQDRERLQQVPGVKRVAMFSFVGGGIAAGEEEAYPLLIAATPEWFEMHDANLDKGRLYTDSDRDVVILGEVAKNSLFGEESAIGQTVLINDKEYEVIGVTESQEQSQSMFSMTSLQNVAYIPFHALKADQPSLQIHRFMIQSDPAADPDQLVPALEAKLGERLSEQQYSVLTQEDLLGMISSFMAVLSTLVIGLTAIALFVGALGIFAIMMMSVNERKREIGVRRAVGAKQRDIFLLVLWEAVFIGALGVLIGSVISVTVAAILRATTVIDPIMTPAAVLLAAGVGVGFSAVAGLLPAMRAARQDPAVSLRNE